MHVGIDLGQKLAFNMPWDHHTIHNMLCMFLGHKRKMWTLVNFVKIHLRLYKLCWKITHEAYLCSSYDTYLPTEEFLADKYLWQFYGKTRER